MDVIISKKKVSFPGSYMVNDEDAVGEGRQDDEICDQSGDEIYIIGNKKDSWTVEPSISERVGQQSTCRMRTGSSSKLSSKRKKRFKTKTKSKDTLRELERELDDDSDSDVEEVRTVVIYCFFKQDAFFFVDQANRYCSRFGFDV